MACPRFDAVNLTWGLAIGFMAGLTLSNWLHAWFHKRLRDD
jgi:hypothetical protein